MEQAELKQIETLSLREYINRELTELQGVCLENLSSPNFEDIMLDTLCANARCIALQNIVYRLEYGFITEIGDTSLKHHLPKT